MVGRPRQKVFCQSYRRRTKIPCQAKGYLLADGTYKCRFHGYNNILGFRKPNYTDDKRINQLQALYQFRNKTREQVKTYYYTTVKPKLIDGKNLSTIEEKLVSGQTLSEILEAKQYQFSLMKFYHFLKKNPKIESKIVEARKLGVQTLIDKLLQVFQYQEVENPNQILWIREKTKFVQYLAGHLTDLYSNNKTQNIKSDTNLTVSWSDFPSDDLIDVSTEETTPTLNKN